MNINRKKVQHDEILLYLHNPKIIKISILTENATNRRH